MKYGICHLGVIPLRAEKSHKSELISQILYGETFKVIEERKDWLKVRIHWDGYEGWVVKRQVTLIEKETYTSINDKAFIPSPHLIDYLQTDKDQLFPIPLGSDLRGLSVLNHQRDEVASPNQKDREALIKTAFQYLNTPYLWGGKTPMGIDCSGLTQMVYKIHGIPLSRDAYLQAEQGNTLSFIEESEPGDLAFFDNQEGNIIHVGILLKHHYILHAHHEVRIDRIDQTGIYNVERQEHSHKLRLIKSIL